MGRVLMITGAALMVAGLLVHYGGRLFSVGRLPGDLVFQKGPFTFYLPLATSLLLSLLLTGLFWLMRKF